jgi:acetyl-CoA carboxylase carboxyltransferase component
MNFAWPTAEIAVMGPDGAVNVIHREEIADSSDPDTTRQKLIAEYRAKYANPYVAASRGYVDDIIEPRFTRARVISALEMLQNKRDSLPPKKHGNMPL